MNLQLPFNTVFLIDGSSLLHRAYHSRQYLTTSKGVPTGAVYGAMQWIKNYIDVYKPLYVVVALDTVRTSFRNGIYPEYKANRSDRDEELQSQFVLFKEFCKHANIPCYDHEDFEADDFLGTLSKKYVEEGFRPYIISGDKDLFQMIDKDVSSLFLSKEGLVLYDEGKFSEEFGGLRPKQLIELKALQGDSSDNIPGVKGVGGKTALRLIQDYETVDALYERIDSVKGKVKENLVECRDNAFLSRSLATIKTDIDCNLETEKVYNLKSSAVSEFCRKLEIRSF